jgi:hypothetical protein
MNSIMKLTAAALGALSIAGGVAVAQSSTSNDTDARSDTANYGTPPGAPLKRDGSLSADPTLTTTKNAPATADSTTTTTSSSTTTTTAAPAADTSNPAPAVANTADTSPPPRADRN